MLRKIITEIILLTFWVRWAAAQDTAQDIKDVRPPVDLPPDYFWWIILLIAVILVLVVFLIRYVMGRFKRAQKEISVPVVLPWERALSQLAQLERENLPAQGKIKEFYIRLSDIVRHYIEGRFDIRAPEMTTEEFLVSLKDSRALDLKQKEFLQDFLNQCDLVKFARHTATAAEMGESLRLAKELVNQTKKMDLQN